MDNNKKVLDYNGLATLVSLIRDLYPLKTDVEQALEEANILYTLDFETPWDPEEPTPELSENDIAMLEGLAQHFDTYKIAKVIIRDENDDIVISTIASISTYVGGEDIINLHLVCNSGSNFAFVDVTFDDTTKEFISLDDYRVVGLALKSESGMSLGLNDGYLDLINADEEAISSVLVSDMQEYFSPYPRYEVTLTTDLFTDTGDSGRTLTTADRNSLRAFYSWAQTVYTDGDYYLQINLSGQATGNQDRDFYNAATIKFSADSLPSEGAINLILPVYANGAWFNQQSLSIGALSVVQLYTRWDETGSSYYKAYVASGPFGWNAISNYALAKTNNSAFTPTDNSYQPATAKYVTDKIASAIAGITTVDFRVVNTLPVSDISTSTIYLVPKSTSQTNNVYDEYVYINSSWELIGTTTIDLSNYYTKTQTYSKTEVDTLVGAVPVISFSYDSSTETLSITTVSTNNSEEED